MGLWASIGQAIGDTVGGGTGSIIKDIANVGDVIAPVISNSGKTAATNRSVKDAQNFEREQLQSQLDRDAIAAAAQKTNGQATASDAVVNQQKASDAARAAAASAAFKGALAKNIQDVRFDRGGLSADVPEMHFTGGLRPSAFGPELRTAGASLNASGQNSLDHPPTFPTIDKVEGVTPKAEVAPASDESIWEKLAGPLSLGLTVAGAAAAGHQPGPTKTETPPVINEPAPTSVPTSQPNLTTEDIIRMLSAPRPAAPANSPFNVGNNINFGPGVAPAPTPGFGGVTFGGR